MLDTPYYFKDPAYTRGDYRLECATEDTWNSKPNKVLIILETVDSQDLKTGRLLSERSRTVIQNLFSYSFDQIKWAAQNVSTGKVNPKWVPTTKDLPFDTHTRKHTSLSAVNFNHRKFFGEGKEVQEAARQSALRRVNQIIDELQPTVVIAFGDNCARLLLAPLKINMPAKKRGWVFKTKTPEGHKYKLVPSLDLYSLYTTKDQQKAQANDDDDAEAGDEKFNLTNLLFYVSEHVQNALVGKLRFDLSKMKSEVVYVDTLDKFKEMWKILIKSKTIAVDTETKNLSVNNNHINTMQFCMDGHTGYVVPLRHPQSPLVGKDRDYIERKLRTFFYAKPGVYPVKFLVFQNGKYDLRVIRREYKIPLIYHPVWELMAGEWCFEGSTLVSTETGQIRIDDLVAMKSPPRVWSFNHSTGKNELKLVLGTSKHPTSKRMVEIEYDGGALKVTEDHKIWSVTRGAYVMAKDLNESDELLLERSDLEPLL